MKTISLAALCLLGFVSSSVATQTSDSAAKPHDPERIDLVYAVYAGGFHVLDAQAYQVRDGNRYHIGAGARTEGFLSWLFDWEGKASSTGHLDNTTRAVPVRHENWGLYNGSERLTAVDYNGSGTVASVVREPEPNWDKYFALPDDAAVGTIDPLSVVAQVLAFVDSGGNCNGEHSVFDGKRRYELYTTDKGREVIPANDYSIYHGPALKCRIDYKMLGGNRKEVSDVARSARNHDIWLATVLEDTSPLPVRVQVETSFGIIVGHLTEVRQGDRKISLDTGS
ncbi:MAG: DUF3108 domain-containing protein [Alphaproteobacteria bacterium]